MLEMLISLGSSTLIDTLRDGLVDFVLEQGQDLIKDELKGKLASLRSDAGLCRQIATAVQAAADRWYEQAADKELVRAVNESTHFADLDSVQQAMRQLARHPSAPIAAATLRGKFAEVLPARFEPERIERGVKEYLDILRDELLTIPALQQTQAAYAQLQTERNSRLSTTRRSSPTCYAVERFQMPDLLPEALASKAEVEIAGIARAIADSPGVRRLAANPLLLRTLALIHRTGARLPQRRIELYRLTAETLIRDWELARGIPQAALVSEAEATRLLGELAAWMHQTKPAGIATEGEVQRKLAEVKGGLAGKEADDPEILQAVDNFLSKIRQYTGLFVVRAPQRYGFMHLTFEEYFAARWLVARPRQAARRIQF